MRRLALLVLVLLLGRVLPAAPRNLDIYFVDVEGGAATLIVTPAGESLLVDTGNPVTDDRDARRIHQATQLAGLKQIDYLLITHFHGDHVGGVPALSKMIPIRRFFDHGDSIEKASNPPAVKQWDAYAAASAGKRTILKPGDKIPLKGLNVQVVSSNGEVLTKPINGGGPNATLCANTKDKDPDPTENARSLGFLLSFGKFQFLDVGDLTWNKERLLACPNNIAGKVDLFQATHHGFFNDMSGPAELIWAIQPQVVIVNNGPRKGLSSTPAHDILAKSPGLQDIWQGHLSLFAKEYNTSENQIANLEPTEQCKGNWLKVSVEPGGRYTVTNGRNNFSKSYTAR
jgi:competence protein ComEC